MRGVGLANFGEFARRLSSRVGSIPAGATTVDLLLLLGFRPAQTSELWDELWAGTRTPLPMSGSADGMVDR